MDVRRISPETDCQLIANTTEEVTFACGHRWAIDYSVIICGVRFDPKAAARDQRENCPTCNLKTAVLGATRCGHCNGPIFKGADCIVYDDGKVSCLRTDCGPGPMGHMPGVWDGDRYVNGLIAGTVVTVKRK